MTERIDGADSSSQTLTQSEIHALTSGRLAENGMGLHYDDPNHPVVRKAVELALAHTSVNGVIEFGAGRGHVARSLAQNGINVVATDINPFGLAELAQFAQSSNLNIQTRKLDVGRRIPDDLVEKFDLVIAKDVLPFVPPDTLNTFFANISAALRTNGRALVSAPFTDSLLYQNSKNFENPNGELTKLLTADAQQFLGTTVSSFNFVTIEYLRNTSNVYSLNLIETGLFGRQNGWIWVVLQKSK